MSKILQFPEQKDLICTGCGSTTTDRRVVETCVLCGGKLRDVNDDPWKAPPPKDFTS